jgi:hypothetical protein
MCRDTILRMENNSILDVDGDEDFAPADTPNLGRRLTAARLARLAHRVIAEAIGRYVEDGINAGVELSTEEAEALRDEILTQSARHARMAI